MVHMGFLKFLLLCVVQGITESLPISSSGHLVLVNAITGSSPLSVGVVILLHVATAVAVSVALRGVLSESLRSFTHSLSQQIRHLAQPDVHTNVNKAGFRLPMLVTLSCLSTALPAAAFRSEIETFFVDPFLVGIALVVNGVILLVIRNHTPGQKSMCEITWYTACFIGLAQFVGVVPGISRLGITLLAALFSGMVWKDAARYSFLISIPVILGGALAEGLADPHSLFGPASELSNGHYIIGLAIVGLLGFGATRLILGRLGRQSMLLFAIWCWVSGAATLLIATAARSERFL
jgi:undecaprenyl-diphosphatase